MVSVSSVESLRNAVALAERKVQQDQTRVDQDARRLEDSKVQLNRDKEQLSGNQKAERQAESAATPTAAPVRLDRAFTTEVPPDALPRAPQLNAQGQTVGRVINIVA
ncbi:hypothetical protein GJ700_04820 [Duganella sp. FT92W]|uniref:Uncharacterized protein n=1 Tax=Pseudoduganella rivuli TaxID=2666085 RepID=A0A7X2LQ69_9BURK|nr:hypothetical protein [Pseudoduganella rivuli]MRV71040.1 hypothetical protein [Pseudoduganella rivuli]